MSWIIPANWERFQHYGYYRRPPWIKNYTALLHKDEYLELPIAARGLLHGIWLAYADRDGLLRTEDVRAALGLRYRLDALTRQLDLLEQAGLIVISASKPLNLKDKAELWLNAEPAPTNIKTAAPKKKARLHNDLLEQAQQVAATWNGGGSDAFDDQISQLERKHHSHLRSSERERLWDQVLANQPPTLGRSDARAQPRT
jgi:hypothetical protein